MILGLVCLFLVLLLRVAFSVHISGDYSLTDLSTGDNAAPGIAALLHGSVSGYLAHQPIVGLTSIVLRLPAVALASAFGAGSLTIYQVGAFVCLMPLALGGAWMLAERGLSRRDRLFRLLAVLLVIRNPILHNSIRAGHPEGVLATVLALAAVVAATRGHARWAAVLLGVSIAAKQTSVIAIPPVLLALPQQRREVCVISGAVLFLLMGIPWLADPAAFMRALDAEGTTRFVLPLSLIWPLTYSVRVPGGVAIAHLMPFHLDRIDATLLMMIPAAVVGGWWYLGERRRGASCNPLAMLALLGALRCVCDSTHELYYYISVLMPLAAWEAFENRLPVGTMLTVLIVPYMFDGIGHVPADLLYLTSTAGELLLVVYLARRAMVPAIAEQVEFAADDPRKPLPASELATISQALLPYAAAQPELDG